jgi:hypothetical protein
MEKLTFFLASLRETSHRKQPWKVTLRNNLESNGRDETGETKASNQLKAPFRKRNQSNARDKSQQLAQSAAPQAKPKQRKRQKLANKSSGSKCASASKTKATGETKASNGSKYRSRT